MMNGDELYEHLQQNRPELDDYPIFLRLQTLKAALNDGNEAVVKRLRKDYVLFRSLSRSQRRAINAAACRSGFPSVVEATYRTDPANPGLHEETTKAKDPDVTINKVLYNTAKRELSLVDSYSVEAEAVYSTVVPLLQTDEVREALRLVVTREPELAVLRHVIDCLREQELLQAAGTGEVMGTDVPVRRAGNGKSSSNISIETKRLKILYEQGFVFGDSAEGIDWERFLRDNPPDTLDMILTHETPTDRTWAAILDAAAAGVVRREGAVYRELIMRRHDPPLSAFVIAASADEFDVSTDQLTKRYEPHLSERQAKAVRTKRPE